MLQNFMEARSGFSHGFRARLAQSNTVPIPDTGEQNVIALFCKRKFIAGNGTPPESLCHGQARAFIGGAQ